MTVVLAVHNGEAGIDAAIASVAAQTYADWDMILIDDASTDGTPAILAAWAARDPRLTVLRNDRNLGLPASLTFGKGKTKKASLAAFKGKLAVANAKYARARTPPAGTA